MSVIVTEANAPERLGAIATIIEDDCDTKELELILADAGSSGSNFALAVMAACGAVVQRLK